MMDVRANNGRSKFVPNGLPPQPARGGDGAAVCRWQSALHWSCLLVLVLSNAAIWLWHVPGHSITPLIIRPLASENPCTSETAGTIFFDTAERRFKGCDGSYWSSLAFCCAPGRPEPPRLSRHTADRRTSIKLSWSPPEARGSPVSSYSLSASRNASAPFLVFSGPALSHTVTEIDPRSHYRFVLTAHAAGGTSEPSVAAELQPAPVPLSFAALDDGDCVFGPGDRLVLRLSGETDCGVGGGGGCGGGQPTPSVDLHSLLRLEAPAGSPSAREEREHLAASLGGLWTSADTLLLAPRAWPNGAADPATALADPYTQRLSVRLLPEGGLSVAAPSLSLPASGASPLLSLPHCFAEGFEGKRGLEGWVVEAADPSTYAQPLLDDRAHSGAHALRLAGGRGSSFDGLSAARLPGRRPTRVSCYLRAAALANVGYLTLGGATLDESVVFFHLKPDGTAGLLSADGGWHSGRFQVGAWLHVVIELDWAVRTSRLWLDGKLVAEGVSFVSNAAVVDALHLFNSDAGTVWWDDLTMAFSDSRFRAAEPALPFVP